MAQLNQYGLKGEYTAELVEKASQATRMKANPTPLTPDELAGILERTLRTDHTSVEIKCGSLQVINISR
jgi:hypothetical protein